MSGPAFKNFKMDENSSKLCLKCLEDITDETLCYTCDICKKNIHKKCVNLSASETKCMPLQKRNLALLCQCCRDVMSKIPEIHNMCRELKADMAVMKEYIKKLTVEKEENLPSVVYGKRQEKDVVLGPSKMYSTAVKKNKELLMVKPVNDEQKSSKTQEEIREKIDPSKMGVRVDNVRNISKGGIIISCGNLESKDKLKKKVQEELGNKYKIEDPKLKNPKIKIKHTELKFIEKEDDTIIQDLIEQNELDNKLKEEIKILKKYENKRRRNSGNIIIEAKLDAFTELMKVGKLNAGWRECDIEEYHSIVQCYKCARFNHLAKVCENNITCFKCSGDHKTEECTNDFLKCINCIKTTEKLKINLNHNHAAFDKNCPCLMKIIERINNRTNYGS